MMEENDLEKLLYKDESGEWQLGRPRKWISKEEAKEMFPDKNQLQAEWGGCLMGFIDGQVKNIADHLNEEERKKGE